MYSLKTRSSVMKERNNSKDIQQTFKVCTLRKCFLFLFCFLLSDFLVAEICFFGSQALSKDVDFGFLSSNGIWG